MTVPSRPSFLAIAGSAGETSNAFDVFVVLAQGVKALLDAREEDRKKTIQALEEARIKNQRQIEELFNRQQNTPSLTNEISRLWSSLTTAKNIAERAEKKANDALSLADKAFMIGRQANELIKTTIQDIQFLTDRNVAALQRVEALIRSEIATARAEARADALRLWLYVDQVGYRIGEIIGRIVRIERTTTTATGTKSQDLGNILSRLNILEIASKQLYQLNLEAMLKTEFNELHIDQANFRIDEVIGDLFNLTKLVNDAKATANSAIQKANDISANISKTVSTTVNQFFYSVDFNSSITNKIQTAMASTGLTGILATLQMIQTSVTDGNARVLNSIQDTAKIQDAKIQDGFRSSERRIKDSVKDKVKEGLCEEINTGQCFNKGLNSWWRNLPYLGLAFDPFNMFVQGLNGLTLQGLIAIKADQIINAIYDSQRGIVGNINNVNGNISNSIAGLGNTINFNTNSNITRLGNTINDNTRISVTRLGDTINTNTNTSIARLGDTVNNNTQNSITRLGDTINNNTQNSITRLGDTINNNTQNSITRLGNTINNNTQNSITRLGDTINNNTQNSITRLGNTINNNTQNSITRLGDTVNNNIQNISQPILFAAVSVPVISCEQDDNGNWTPVRELINVDVIVSENGSEAQKVLNEYEQLARIAESQCLAKNQELEAYAATPDAWQIRPESTRLQMVFQFAELTNDRKLNSAKYEICVPHTKPGYKPSPDRCPLPSYTKGNWEVIYVLSDNSRITIYALNQAEGAKMLKACKAIVDPKYLENSYLSKDGIVVTSEPLRQILVKPRMSKLFSKGRKNMKPDWVVHFD